MNSDYTYISKAINFVHQNALSHPNFDNIASSVELSSDHFQQILKRWAEITPKQFLQYLTKDHAKQILTNSNTHETALEARICRHRLINGHFVELETLASDEIKLKRQNLIITYGISSSPFGNVFIATTTRGICQLSFSCNHNSTCHLDSFRKKWPKAELKENTKQINKLAESIFNLSPKTKVNLALVVQGTIFQIKVWKILLQLKPGKLCSYGQAAAAIGQPSASRATANAIGANPISYLIPCHRVIRNTGALGGYRWGIERKLAMLTWESANLDNNSSDAALKYC